MFFRTVGRLKWALLGAVLLSSVLPMVVPQRVFAGCQDTDGHTMNVTLSDKTNTTATVIAYRDSSADGFPGSYELKYNNGVYTNNNISLDAAPGSDVSKGNPLLNFVVKVYPTSDTKGAIIGQSKDTYFDACKDLNITVAVQSMTSIRTTAGLDGTLMLADTGQSKPVTASSLATVTISGPNGFNQKPPVNDKGQFNLPPSLKSGIYTLLANQLYTDTNGLDQIPLATKVDFTITDADIKAGVKHLGTITLKRVTDQNVYKDPNAQDASTSDSANLQLDCHAGFNPLNWLICGVVKGMVQIVNGVDNLLNSMLSVGTQGNNGTDPTDIFSTSSVSGGGYYAAWKTFRNIGLGLLFIAGLVVIIATELGTDLVDAYTVRKVLPRLVIATIGISLSWELMHFLVQFTNALGYGIREIIYAPFRGLSNSTDLGGGGDVATSLIAVGAIAALGIFGLLSFAATAALAVFVAFLVLILRQIIITVLVLLAPIAIVAYVLPNTQKVYKIWWDSFSKALLMFPIISGIVAAGRVFSVVANSTANSNQGSISPAVEHLIAFAAYFAPYFLIPYTLKFAGGALGRLGGMVNDKSRGAFNRLSKFRAGQPARRWDKAKKGEMYPVLSNFGPKGEAINRGIQRATRPDSLLPGRLGLRGQSVISTRTSGAVNDAAKHLQADGLLDDTAGNEFIQYGHSLGMLNKRVNDLRANGQGALADQLSAYAKYAGNREAILGAMKLNASFGKLQDNSLKQLDHLFGDSTAEKAAKQAVFGDLIFTSKGAGNYATYSARIVDNKVKTMSDSDYRDTARQNMAKALMDAGPNVMSNIKPYRDTSSGDGYQVKDEVAMASLGSIKDWRSAADGGYTPEQRQRAIENVASQVQLGAYNDPNMKAAFTQAVSDMRAKTAAAQADLAAYKPLTGEQVGLLREDYTIRVKNDAGEYENKQVNAADYLEHIQGQARGAIDPRLLGEEGAGSAKPPEL